MCGRPCRTLVGATRVEDGVAWRRRRLMVLGIGLQLLDLNQVPVVGTPARLFPLARWAVAVAGVVGRTGRTAGHKEASCG
jgi:hypothetical protein